MALSFSLTNQLTDGYARTGELQTPHGVIQTPAFAVVGTKATVKAVPPEYLIAAGVQVVLANTYHLYLQPGHDVVAQAGGFGPFMNWAGPTMTDSGGFQVFSLGDAFGGGVSKIASGKDAFDEHQSSHGRLSRIDEEGVTFTSHIDGSTHRFTPEHSMEVQWDLGADMIFAFDECTSPYADAAYQREALDRTHRWAQRCLDRHEELDVENKQALFGIVQGGRDETLRKQSARTIASMRSAGGAAFDGFGIGGSFGKEDMGTAVRWVNEILPEEKPRHLLGIGEPGDVFTAVENGCDLFDCVAPTRNGRTGTVYTRTGPLHINRGVHGTDMKPIDDTCSCYTCMNYSRAYVNHLFRAKEMFAGTLASVHNISFMINLMQSIREAIAAGTFYEKKEEFFNQYY